MDKSIDLLNQYPKDLVHQVLYEQDCDIAEDFIGFINTYEKLAELIPTTWTIVDFGCAYATQAWYFRCHKQYIGVDIGDSFRFHTENTTHYTMSVEEWIARFIKSMPRTTFAIANYLPCDTKIIRESFNYCYIYYPERDETWPKLSLKKSRVNDVYN